MLCKSFVVIVSPACLCALAGISMAEFFQWLGTQEMLTKTEKVEVKSFDYPKVTICNPHYFNMDKAKGKI